MVIKDDGVWRRARVSLSPSEEPVASGADVGSHSRTMRCVPSVKAKRWVGLKGVVPMVGFSPIRIGSSATVVVVRHSTAPGRL